MSARSLMFQGTGSDVGKSLLVAGLCRWAKNRGIKVQPFKPQNMSNNAAVAEGNGEVGSCLLYTSPSPRDGCRSRMPSSA